MAQVFRVPVQVCTISYFSRLVSENAAGWPQLARARLVDGGRYGTSHVECAAAIRRRTLSASCGYQRARPQRALPIPATSSGTRLRWLSGTLGVHRAHGASGFGARRPALVGRTPRLGRTAGRGIRNDGADTQPFGQCGLLHGPQSDMLHPNRSGTEQFLGVDVDVLEIGAPVRRRGSGADAVPGEQRGGDALGMRLQRRGDIGGQGHPAGEELVDASAEHRPLALRDIEVPPQVGQGALPHLVADTL